MRAASSDPRAHLSSHELAVLEDAFTRSAFFFHAGKAGAAEEYLHIADRENLKSLLKSVWTKRANSYFDNISILPEFTSKAPEHEVIKQLIRKGLVREYGVDNSIYDKKHVVVTILGIIAIAHEHYDLNAILEVVSEIMIDDKINRLKRTCSGVIKKEYAVFVILLAYFGLNRECPLTVKDSGDRRYFRIALNEIGSSIFWKWKTVVKGNFYQKFYNEIMVVFYQSGGVFRYDSSRKDRDYRRYWLEEQDQRQLRTLLFKVAHSISSGFRDEKALAELSDIPERMTKSLRRTPLEGIPLTVRDTLKKIGVDDFDLTSERKRIVTEYLQEISTMKRNFSP